MEKKARQPKNQTPEPPQVMDPTSKKEREKKKAPQSNNKGASKGSKKH